MTATQQAHIAAAIAKGYGLPPDIAEPSCEKWYMKSRMPITNKP